MPWFLRDNCVVKGTKENPGATVKCHGSRAKASAHLRALYVNIDDAVLKGVTGFANASNILESSVHRSFTDAADSLYGIGLMNRDERIELSGAIGSSLKQLSVVLDKLDMRARQVTPQMASSIIGLSRINGNDHYTRYRSIDVEKDRWIAISTREEWDREDELFTKEAIDYDIALAHETKEFPEFRLYHVRGFKLGMCDTMTRSKDRAVDEGYWYKTKFAQAMKAVVVRNTGRWKISRGFYSLEATGLCRRCNKDLQVRPINYTMGVVCPDCRMYHPNATLSKLKHLKTKTFDITVTDVPAVASTAVAAYSISS